MEGFVNEGESLESTLANKSEENACLVCIEEVIDHGNSHIFYVWGLEEPPEVHVYVGGDVISRVDTFFPPVAAHKAEGKDHESSSYHSAQESSHVHGL